MEISLHKQIFDQYARAKKVLIVLPQSPDPDALASALALRIFLKKIGKQGLVLCSNEIPNKLKFLPGSKEVLKEINNPRDLVVVVDISKKTLSEVSYEKEGEKVNIHLKTDAQGFVPEDISFLESGSSFDLLVFIGLSNLDDLGKVLEKNAEWIYEVPRINIDNKPSNEFFGTINLVDITAASVTEVLYEHFESYEKKLIDEDLATCLLAGIIARTHSFQDPLTTPKAFLKASQLVALGARQQEIIIHLFKTKSLSLLKLWGRALARLKILEHNKTAYSVLNPQDMEKSESEEKELPMVLHELVNNMSDFKVLGLVAQKKSGESVIFAAVHEQVGEKRFLEKFRESDKYFVHLSWPHSFLEIIPESMSLEETEQKFHQLLKEI